jgi:hypothetical protein
MRPAPPLCKQGVRVRVPLAPPFTDTALGGTPTTARESGGSHSDFTALLVPPAVQKVQPGPIRRGSQMVKVEAGQGRG